MGGSSRVRVKKEPTEEEFLDDTVYTVERILKRRTVNKRPQYLVKWQNYGE